MGTSSRDETVDPNNGTRLRESLDRMVALQTITTELASAYDGARVAEVIVENAGRAVGAIAAAIWVACGDEARLVGSVGFSGTLKASVAVVPLSLPAPLTIAMTQRRPVFVESGKAYATRYPEAARRISTLGSVPGAVASLPMLTGSTVIGGLTLAWDTPRSFDAGDVVYLETVAGHAALALERARLFAREHDTRARIELLYRFASAVTQARSLDCVFEPALDAVCEALSIDRASILLFDEHRTVMRFRAWRGLSETYRKAVEGHSPWTPNALRPAPIFIDDVSAESSLDRLRPTLDAEGIRALGFIPLLYDHKLLGKFMIYAREPRAFTDDDRGMATAVATHIAQAVARWTAEDAALRAKVAAEKAAAARESLLAMVAHDLRNPLGVAQLKAQVMLRRLPPGELGAQLKQDLEMIHRNARHMARLIDDLVDVAAIDAGRLSIERAPSSASEIFTEALELARPLAEPKRLRLVGSSSVGDARIDCDRQRVIQVLSNLIGNAIKFTPEGGTITIEAARDDGFVRFAVADDGPGIPPADRERVFEQWTRGKKRGGIGLGLFIARGLVHAHGGRIWIEGNRDAAGVEQGTRVAFTMPRC